MPSQLVNELLSTMDSKIFSLVLQLIIVGSIIMFIKDFTGRIVNYYKLKMSDFSRNIKIEINSHEGYIRHIGFSEVEIELDESRTMFIPVDKFMSSIKIISVEVKRASDRRK